MVQFDRDAFAQAAKADFEFCRETRYLTGRLKLDFGDAAWALMFEDGKLAGVSDGADVSDDACLIVVGGRPDQWDELLRDRPRPFYQCLQSAAVKHGMRMSATDATFAYLPGLNRMTTLLRRLRNGEAPR